MKDNILIVRGPRTSNPETNENIWLYVTSAASKGYRVTVVGDGTREVSIQEITSAANELKGNTQLIVHAHGGVNKDGDYVLGLNKGNQNSQNSISESSVTIEFSSNAVTGSSFAKSLPKNISSVSYLTCSSGAAPVHEHNPGTSVYMFSNPSAGKAGGYSNDSVNATFLIAANSGKSGADAMHTIALMTAPLRDSIASLEPFQNFQFNDRTLALQGEETGISGLGVVDLSDSMKFFKDRGYTNDTISQLAELLLAGNAMIVTNKGSVPMTPEQAKEYVKSVSNEVKNTGTDEIRTTNNNDIGLPKGSGLQFEFFNEHNITSHFVTKYSVALALTAIEMRAQGKTKAIEIPELDDAARALARNFGDMLKQANVTTSQPDTRTGYVPVGKHSDIDLVRR